MFQYNNPTSQQSNNKSFRVNLRVNPRLSASTKKGFTLLEVMIAIFLIVVGITGAFTLITKTLGQMAVSSSQLIAAYLTQEGIEIVRNIRDTNWLEQTRPSTSTNSWDEGLALVECATGCTVDYTYTASEDPSLLAIPVDNFLYIDGADGFYKYIPTPVPGDIQTKFKRKITIDTSTPDILEVKVEVLWEEKGKSYQYTAQENLYNWR